MYDKLPPNEQAAISSMGNRQCLSKLAEAYGNWKSESATQVFSNTKAYKRNVGWKFTGKGDSGDITIDIGIWKRTATEIYFLISDSRATFPSYFLRITQVENDEMIEDLKQAHCLRPEIYKSSINSSTLTMTNEYTLMIPPNKDVYTDVYSMSLKQLAFFANFNYTRTKKTYDVNDDQTGDTVSYNTAKLEPLGRDYDTYLNWSDPTRYTQKFCVIHNSEPYRFVKERNAVGFKILESDCEDTPPAGWDLNPATSI